MKSMQPVFDAHCDTVLRIVDKGADISVKSDQGHIDLPRLLEAGVGCQVFACFASKEEYPENVVDRSQKLLDAALELEQDERVIFPRTSFELYSLYQANGKVGILLAIEGGEALGAEPDNVSKVKQLGVRYITLAWGDNELGGSAFGENYGLTDIGKIMVREMERQHVLVDVSHLSDTGFQDVFKTISAPVIASHSNSRAICPSPRNLSDDQIRAIAERGGVIGVTFVSGFLSAETAKSQAPIFAKYMKQARANPGNLEEFMEKASDEIAKLPQPQFESIADHVDHIASVGGIDAVAFGSDFDGFRVGPRDLTDCTDYPRIIDILRKRGYSDSDLRKVCWENWARIFSWTFER